LAGSGQTDASVLRSGVPMIQNAARMARCLASLSQMPAEEIDDDCVGFNAASAGEELDENKSKAWLRGWSEGQE